MCQALPLLTQGGPGCVGETLALRFLLHGFNKNPSVLQRVDFCPPFPHLHTGSRLFVCFVFYTLLLVTELVSNQGLDRVIPVYCLEFRDGFGEQIFISCLIEGSRGLQ